MSRQMTKALNSTKYMKKFPPNRVRHVILAKRYYFSYTRQVKFLYCVYYFYFGDNTQCMTDCR